MIRAARHTICRKAVPLIVALVILLSSISGCGRGGSPPGAPSPATNVPALLEELKVLKGSESVGRRNLAANRLGRLGAKASDAIDELEDVANSDPNPDVRETAKLALAKIRGGL